MRKIDAGQFGGIGWGRIAGVSYLDIRAGSWNRFWIVGRAVHDGCPHEGEISNTPTGQIPARPAFAVRDCLW